MSNLTSTCGTPRGAGGMPSSRKLPRDLLSRTNSRSPDSTVSNHLLTFLIFLHVLHILRWGHSPTDLVPLMRDVAGPIADSPPGYIVAKICNLLDTEFLAIQSWLKTIQHAYKSPTTIMFMVKSVPGSTHRQPFRETLLLHQLTNSVQVRTVTHPAAR